jgi:hypothetical protein
MEDATANNQWARAQNGMHPTMLRAGLNISST